MNKNIEKLKGMIGQSFLKNGEKISLLNYEAEGESVTIITSKLTIKTTVFDLGVELAKLKPLQDVQIVKAQPLELQIASKENVSYLNEMIKQNIEAVKKDRDFVRQAKSIREDLKLIIEAAKLELAIHKQTGF